MDILQTVLGAQNGDVVKQLSQALGIDETHLKSAIQSLLPALVAGLQQRMADPQGLESLLRALSNAPAEPNLKTTNTTSRQTVVKEGNTLLGEILGNKDVSRAVAGRAASRTGIDTGILKILLPLLAVFLVSTLTKQLLRSGFSGQTRDSGASNDSLKSTLTTLLDFNKNGTIADEMMQFVTVLMSSTAASRAGMPAAASFQKPIKPA